MCAGRRVGGIAGFRILNQRRGTHNEQFNDPKWQAAEAADLQFKFYCTQPQEIILVVNGRYEQRLKITASNDWQTLRVPAAGLINKHNQQPMASCRRPSV